ncbi:hypothetical protein [Pseudoprimorskyibacter insulae]|uniref:Uncharacterized protein n=1 Tax=Pseudoprimorskyibacter insulae TaxID=1695997 RepID=A0A2R8AWS7_9RHOB|nr:hypothetical protein [Pseudoprimorskyibacter insulae]SPF80505.1 hypothetical protein PRI8871_02315 [Pseudoprimorskyibacter insulae]
MFNLEPNYTVLSFFFIKKFLFLQAIAVLALARLALGPALARLFALAAFVLAVIGIATTFAPAMGWTGIPGHGHAARAMIWQSGMVAMLLPALVLMGSAIARPRRAPWIEVLTFLAIVGLVGLWIATMF